MGLYRGYQGATRCTSGPTPGARALMAWFLGAYGPRGGTNLGIFNCRSVRGGTTTSLHGEGRADDFGINPHGAAWGTELADRLRLNSAELGIQCLIWNRKIWSGSYPTAGWRPYNGVAAHLDHIHCEMSWEAANTLTAARVAQVMGGTPSAAARPATPAAPPAPPKPKGIPKMIERRLTVGNNHGRIVCPAEARSKIASEVWVSVSGEGGCKGRVAFQVNSDTDGAPAGAGPAWDLTLRNGNRAAKRIPATTEFLEYWVTVNGVQGSGEGSLLVEFVPR